MDEIWIEAVSQFIKGEEWHQTMKIFIDNHCELFSNLSLNDKEFMIGHYQVYQEFKSLCDALLENLIVELGGSIG